MDTETQRAVAKALDISIADVAREELQRLSDTLEPFDIAEAICASLHSLERLQFSQGPMPDYDRWDAPFYAFWYQPVQINLAYTLARTIPREVNPLLAGHSSLQVHDFGCGELAMQFGLALAAADTLKEGGNIPDIVIFSGDSSDFMAQFGWRLWDRFVNEIADSNEYPALDVLRGVCAAMRFDDGLRHNATQWLTVLHVAYAENASEVKRVLEDRVKKRKTDLILVTTHPSAFRYAYSPEQRYLDYDRGTITNKAPLLREGNFEVTNKFRTDIADRVIGIEPILLIPKEHAFTVKYLKNPTAWHRPSYKARWTVYTRR